VYSTLVTVALTSPGTLALGQCLGIRALFDRVDHFGKVQAQTIDEMPTSMTMSAPMSM
jgi:hypothetical protein